MFPIAVVGKNKYILATIVNVVNVFTPFYFPMIVNYILSAIAYLWSSYSSLGFMRSQVGHDKNIIAVYPIFLFFGFLTSYVITI